MSNMNKFALLVIFAFGLLAFPVVTSAESLMGQVLDRRGIPVPGMEVVLYNPDAGLSRSRYTSRDGVFYFNFVPLVRGQYDIEFYWRGNLVYRDRIVIRGNLQLAPYRF